VRFHWATLYIYLINNIRTYGFRLQRGQFWSTSPACQCRSMKLEAVENCLQPHGLAWSWWSSPPGTAEAGLYKSYAVPVAQPTNIVRALEGPTVAVDVKQECCQSNMQFIATKSAVQFAMLCCDVASPLNLSLYSAVERSSSCMCRYSAEEIHFNLMAIVSDRLQQYQKSIDEIHRQIEVSSCNSGNNASTLTMVVINSFEFLKFHKNVKT